MMRYKGWLGGKDGRIWVLRNYSMAPYCLVFHVLIANISVFSQWCRGKSIARGALLIARGGSFLVCIFIRNFEVESTYLYKKMIMSF